MQCSFYKMQGAHADAQGYSAFILQQRGRVRQWQVCLFFAGIFGQSAKSPGGAGRFGMRAACALRIFSGRIIFISRLSRSAERSKRIFTGGVATVSGIYRKQDRKKPRRAGALRGRKD
jgi:hypothetical protein